MQKKYLLLIVCILVVCCVSCALDDDKELGVFPELPENFEAINSVYDDYNMDLPRDLWVEFPILFSSNRKSQGQNFDLVDFMVYYNYFSSTEKAVFDTMPGKYWLYDLVVETVNTDFNEYGPFVVFLNSTDYLFFYATDSSGNLDINYLYGNTFFGLQDSAALIPANSNYNEAYPTFNPQISEMYFCCDSTGNFDIYKISLPPNSPVINWVKSHEKSALTEMDLLNSTADDKCPYINRNLMVFTSNRLDGYGGYDLYYSEFKNNAWSEPVNFGPEINSEYDEYRPVTTYASNYENDLMIFSSNRPGGLGGYDLYFVGIPKMIY